MKNTKELIIKINELTTKIETEYPELYPFIDEQPLTIPASDHPDTNSKALKDYLQSLEQLLQHHLETHKS